MEIQIDPIDNQSSNPKNTFGKPSKESRPGSNSPASGKGIFIGIIAVLLVILIGAVTWLVISLAAGREQQSQLDEAVQARQKAELDLAQNQMNQDFDRLNEEFLTLENQRTIMMDDSVKRELTEKYEAARLQVEKLQNELKNQKNMSVAQINKLKDEIATLRGLLKHYLEEINRLNQENEALRSENEEIKTENSRLNSQVEQTSRQNEVLTQRMTLAEKLNVTGLTLTPLNKKGKDEKKVSKARQLMVSFTIPQNNSTPVGEKTIYMRLLSPSGQLLGQGGKFSFEGGSVDCSARKTIEYQGQEIPGVKIYWDVNTALDPGTYTVELFADNYRLARRTFNLK